MMSREKILTRKRTKRNLLSKRKRWMSRRGMVSQAKIGKGYWKKLFLKGQEEIRKMPLRGIAVRKEVPLEKKKVSFLKRIFSGKGRGK